MHRFKQASTHSTLAGSQRERAQGPSPPPPCNPADGQRRAFSGYVQHQALDKETKAIQRSPGDPSNFEIVPESHEHENRPCDEGASFVSAHRHVHVLDDPEMEGPVPGFSFGAYACVSKLCVRQPRIEMEGPVPGAPEARESVVVAHTAVHVVRRLRPIRHALGARSSAHGPCAKHAEPQPFLSSATHESACLHADVACIASRAALAPAIRQITRNLM